MTVTQEHTMQQMQPLPLSDWLSAVGDEPTHAWRERVRAVGAASFRERGLPARRDEEWRQLNLRVIESARLVKPEAVSVASDELSHLSFPGLDAATLTFVGGQFVDSLSDVDGMPAPVTITTFNSADPDVAGLIEKHLNTLAPTATDPFAALNAASFSDGVLIHVPRGVAVDRPIRIAHINADARPSLVSPRVLIVAEESSDVTIIEDFGAALDADGYMTNGVVEVVLDANAEVRHYFIEREAPNAICMSSRNVQIARDARFRSHSIMFGAALVRNNISPRITGPGADCLLNGVYITGGEQQVDTHVRLTHAAPNCTSNQYFRGVLNGASRGNFTGRIIVDRVAQKTDAVQSSQHLLLSDDARAHSKPQLEIFADDVRCTHGATIGQLDADGLFYLKSRGMTDAIARSLLVYAFASEGIDLMRLEPVKDVVKDMLVARLPEAAALRDIF